MCCGHEEGVAAPAKAVLDVGVGELGPMEEVGSGHVDGVRAPLLDFRTVGVEAKCGCGALAEECVHLPACDERMTFIG